MDILLIAFSIGVILLIIEMTTLTFYLFVLGFSLIISSIIGYFLNLINLPLNNNYFIFLISLVCISFFMIFKKTKIYNKFYCKTEHFLDNTFIDVGNLVTLMNDTFSEQYEIINCKYRGAEWSAKFDKSLTEEDKNKIKIY